MLKPLFGQALIISQAIATDAVLPDVNLNCFINNNSLNGFDLLGLSWSITRDSSKSLADAVPDDDTITALASKIGLNIADYTKWLTDGDGLGIPSPTEKLKCRKLKIPNVVFAYWAGWGGGGSTGKWWVDWDDSVNYLRSLGFGVIALDHVNGSSYVLQNDLQMAAADKVLHGLYFWGHGWAPYPSSGLTADGSPDQIVDYTSGTPISLSYKMALALIYACDSNSGKSVLSSQTGGSIWHGYNGTLAPFSPGLPWIWHPYRVDNYIDHGDQGTK